MDEKKKRMTARMTALGAMMATAVLAACATSAPRSDLQAMAIERDKGLAAVNAFRAENGLKPLSIDEGLMTAAASQSEAMARRDKMDHAVAGALPGRVEDAGYHWGTTAENIGRGYPTYDAAMTGWINSPGHRKNLLNPNVTQIGFAGARLAGSPRPYWAQIFAAPSRNPPTVKPEKPMRWGPELRFP